MYVNDLVLLSETIEGDSNEIRKWTNTFGKPM